MGDWWTLVAQEQYGGGNFHTNKDAGGMWCREHSHRGLSIVFSFNDVFCLVMSCMLLLTRYTVYM